MRRATALVSLVLVVELTGCLYAGGNLEPDRHGGYKNYPASVEAERARRAHRRKIALIGAPIELVGGLALAGLMLYAPSSSSPADDGDDSVTDNLGDGAKEVLTRLVLASAGLSIAASGVGDLVLGATDPAFGSPLVRDGRLIAADQIDRIAPARAPRLGFHVSNNLSLRGVGADVGVGLGHWLGRSVRVREAVTGGWDADFGDDRRELRYALGGDLTVERAFGRRHAGLYPTSALGLYGGASWTRFDARDRAVLRGGLSLLVGKTQLRLGALDVGGRDATPTIELGLRYELETD